MHWLAHVLGIDTQQSGWYDFWSGSGAQLALLIGAIGYLRKHTCHERRCPRIGKHTYEGTPYCTRHHPEGPRRSRGGSDPRA